MKLFIGIELSTTIKKYIAECVTPLQLTPKGWENPNDYHLTLLFLGETPVEAIASISERLEKISYKSFEVELASFEFFSRRVLFVNLKNSLEILGLKKRIDEQFAEWKRIESKSFIPHITVKRWQRYEFKFLEEQIKNHPFLPLKIKVNGLALFKSEKDSNNNKYHVLHKVEFKN